MSLVAYSRCRIRFVPASRQRSERNYSDRSLIELRQYSPNEYSLRGVDVDQNKQEIFNIPFKQQDQLKYGKNKDDPDVIPSRSGNYLLWLNDDTRVKFHRAAAETQKTVNHISESASSTSNTHNRMTTDGHHNNHRPNSHSNISTHDTVQQELLLDIYGLGESIQEGDYDAAARLASQIARQNVRIQATPVMTTQREHPFKINVQCDGEEYAADQRGCVIPVSVFLSTTVRNLRAHFEWLRQYPPNCQYFFVNGRLAYDRQTMEELKVGPNSLFILFLLSNRKLTPKSGPWICATCTRSNNEHNLRCSLCTAMRPDESILIH